MKRISAAEFLTKGRVRGRTWTDAEGLHFNWSGSGLSFEFEGSVLICDLKAWGSKEFEGEPGVMSGPFHWNWPCLAVFIDHDPEPARILKITEQTSRQLIIQTECRQKHHIRLVKLTENFKTGLCLRAMFTDGELHEAAESERPKIEFIGDSITCGFGNMTAERDRFYYSEEENICLSHGPLAAEKLGMDWSAVCLSGICLTEQESIPLPFSVSSLYEFTDLPGQTLLHKEVEKWDFTEYPADYIVLNIGTNDSVAAVFSEDAAFVEQRFIRSYADFLEKLRRLNGPEAHIICAMGSIDYYFYDAVLKASELYQNKHHDCRISCLKYRRISPLDPVGALYHPHYSTHMKMAEDLVKHIRQIIKGNS